MTRPADERAGGVLRQRDFRLLWSGQTVSAVGDQIFPVAVAIAVLDSGGTAGDLGLVLAARFLALVLFVLVGGVWADRIPRRLVMAGADAVRLVAVLGLAVAGEAPVWALAALVFLVGGGEAFFQPAYAAILPTVLPDGLLERANAVTSVARRTAAVAGPAVGGALVATVGTGWAFVVDGLTFAVSLGTLLAVHESRLIPAPRRGAVREVAEGIRAVWERPWIAGVVGMASVQLMLAMAPVAVFLPVIAREDLGGNGAYGALLALFAVGGLGGALLAARWRPRRTGIVALTFVSAYAAVPLALALSDQFAVNAVAQVVAGLGIEPFVIYWSAALARDVPRALLARVSSLDWLSSFGLMPVGLALAGPAAELVGRRPVLLLAAVAMSVPNFLLLALVPSAREFSSRVA